MTDKPKGAGDALLFIDNPQAPDVFSSGASGFFLMGPNVGITFETFRVNHGTNPGPVSRVVIGRLVMSIEDTQRLALGLYDFLKQRGLDPADVVASPADRERAQ